MIRKSAESSHIKNEIRGCVDLGSSKFRLLVVEGSFPGTALGAPAAPDDFSFREDKRYVGWGEDFAKTGAVSRESFARAARTLRGLVERAGELGCPSPAIVATNTLRAARNAREMKAGLEEACRLPVRVLAQREEAEMAYAGAAYFQPPDSSILLVDLGGGSTEISWGRGRVMEGWRGMPWGTHRVRALLERAGYHRTAARLAGGLSDSGQELPGSAGSVYPLPVLAQHHTILVTGGTAVSVAVCLRSMRGASPVFEEMERVTLRDVGLVRARVAGLCRAGRERTVPLDADRIRLFPSGLLLIEALLGSARVEAFQVTARDVRWGVVLTGGGS